MSLAKLPVDITCLICEQVFFCDLTRSSIFSLSLTCREFAEATRPQRFERVTLRLSSIAKLQDEVSQCQAILSIGGGANASQVRRLRILGSVTLCPESNVDTRTTDDEDDLTSETDIDELSWASGNYMLLELPTNENYHHHHQYCNCPWPRHHNTIRTNEIWQPVADLIRNFERLRDLFFCTQQDMPQCILNTLHGYHPSCRLHMPYFFLKSLLYLKESPIIINKDEFNLITSPCLFSIAVSYCAYSGGHVDYTEEAVWAMVSKYAPNLGRVCVESNIHGGCLEFQRASATPRPPWKGFHLQGTSTKQPERSIGQLTSLGLGGPAFRLEDFQTWTSLTDFSQLTSLQLHFLLSSSIWQTLRQMAENNAFKMLYQLKLCLPHDDDSIKDTTSFLEAIPPLSELTIDNFDSDSIVFETIFAHHGATLESLKSVENDYGCYPYSRAMVERIIEHCPNLRELALTILRSNNDVEEQSIYSTLSKLKKLEILILYLAVVEPKDDNYRQNILLNSDEVLLNLLDDLFDNLTIDADFVRSVFRKVSHPIITTTPTTTTTSIQSQSLQYLQLKFSGLSNIPDISTEDDPFCGYVVPWIARSWSCQPSSQWKEQLDRVKENSNISKESLFVQEIGALTRLKFKEDAEQAQQSTGVLGQAWRRRGFSVEADTA